MACVMKNLTLYTYENNTQIGTATVVLKGKDNFIGEKHINFKIDVRRGPI